MATKKLFLLDGMALVYRAHFALNKNPRFTANGLNTSAVMGFVNTLLEVLKKEKPSHIAVVFDTPAPTDRHIEFEGYKANRQSMPEDLSTALPYVFKVIEGFGIPVITSDGYEADDIIGTLAKKAEKEGFVTYCMTPDKDFAQLVSDSIFLYKPARMGNDVEIMGVPEVLKKWEIDHVSQVIDILGLWGDAVDNIPGIPGVGEKTAKLLVKQYGSMENIIANAHQLKGKIQENVMQYAEQGMLSKRLATILLDAPVTFDEYSLQLSSPHKEILEPLFAELEFRTLGKRVFGENFNIVESKNNNLISGQMDLFSSPPPIPSPQEEKISVANNINNTPHKYKLISSPQERIQLIEQLQQQSKFCFDTETTGTDANQVSLVGIAFSFQTGEGFYVPIPENQEQAHSIIHEFKPILENNQIAKVGHNLKYDIIVLKWYNIEVKGTLLDTMLAHYLIDPDARHGMDILAENYLDYSPIPITELIGKKGKNQGSMRDVSIETVKEYAVEDADITWQLLYKFEPQLKDFNAQNLYQDVENPLIYVLAQMEKTGVKIDIEILKKYSLILEQDIQSLEQQIYTKAGLKFNIASPKQLGDVLFEHLKLDSKAKKTKTGQYQTNEDVLLALAKKNNIVQDIVDYRQLQKLKSTYVDALPTMINPKTGRVHTSYNQAVAATGRLSSTNPNLQNIPIRTAKGREVRKAFVAPQPDWVLLSADYSQIELRIIAEISQDENMLNAFESGKDIHTATAAKVYNIPLEEVSNEQRRNAKAVNFGIIYGQSAFGLSQNLGISRTEASQIISTYFEQYPQIKNYMTSIVEKARQKGYVETLLGRRRYLRDINSANAVTRGFAERNAINAPIQGSAADMIKLAMINIHQALEQQELQTRMIMQVHDELVFEVPKNEIEQAKNIITIGMKNALKTKVPIEIEIGEGANWLEAH